MNQGDIVSVLTMAGEFVGKLVNVTGPNIVTLSDARMLVQTNDNVGFAHGVCLTGENNVDTIDFYNPVLVVKTNENFEKAWRKATSGIIT